MFSLSTAQAAFDYALQYAKEQHAFGKPIGSFQIACRASELAARHGMEILGREPRAAAQLVR